MSDRDLVAELDRQRVATANAGDASAMRELFADDYKHVHTTGTIDTADQYVAGATSGARRIEPREPEIRLLGDTAVLSGPQVLHVTGPSGVRTLKMWCLQIAHRFPEGWKFIALQATTTPE